MQVAFKRAFLKDVERLPPEVRAKIQNIVFVEIPALDRLQHLPGVKKLTGFQSYYRLRIGSYSLGFKYEDGKVTIYRVLHRKEIYKHFP